MKYAIYDTQDKCWLGTADGVKTWDDFDYARAAATIATEQLPCERGRFRAKAYDGQAKQFKDEIPTLMTPLQAIQKIEGTKE